MGEGEGNAGDKGIVGLHEIRRGSADDKERAGVLTLDERRRSGRGSTGIKGNGRAMPGLDGRRRGSAGDNERAGVLARDGRRRGSATDEGTASFKDRR
jgi:hypothetical protein